MQDVFRVWMPRGAIFGDGEERHQRRGDSGREGGFFFIGTHGMNINQAIKVRDQGPAPGAPVVKRAMEDKAHVQAALFGLVVDIEGAHNLVPVRAEDWRHQCCRVGEDAGLYWERAAGALSRLTQTRRSFPPARSSGST